MSEKLFLRLWVRGLRRLLHRRHRLWSCWAERSLWKVCIPLVSVWWSCSKGSTAAHCASTARSTWGASARMAGTFPILPRLVRFLFIFFSSIENSTSSLTGIRLKGRPSRPNACDKQEQRDHVLQLLLRRLQPRRQRRRLLETSSWMSNTSGVILSALFCSFFAQFSKKFCINILHQLNAKLIQKR